MIQIEYMLIISAVMMCAGIFGFITRRSTLAVLLSIELMLNSADLNFAVFNRMCNFGGNEGYLIYRMLKGIQVDKLEKMKG